MTCAYLRFHDICLLELCTETTQHIIIPNRKTTNHSLGPEARLSPLSPLRKMRETTASLSLCGSFLPHESVS